MPPGSQIPVIYIASHARSGSTLVGSVLGLAERYTYVGEVREVWRDGLIDNQPCGCGKKFRDCPFWTVVFDQAFGGFDSPEVEMAANRINNMTRLPATLRQFYLAWAFPRNHGVTNEITAPLGRLYAAIAAVSKASVIVDSSKTMRYAAALAGTPGIDVRMVNLIRDPRAIIHSRTRQARHRDGTVKAAAPGYGRYRLFRVIAKWAVRNALAARVISRDGGIRLLYEDFVKDQSAFLVEQAGPQRAAQIQAALEHGVPPDVVQHQIGGNWVRNLRIASSDTWRTELPWFRRHLAGVLSAPFRWRYRSAILRPGLPEKPLTPEA